MRYLRIGAAWLIGLLIVLVAAAIGTPLLLVGKACEGLTCLGESGSKGVRRCQRACWKPFQRAYEFAKKVHPDGGGHGL